MTTLPTPPKPPGSAAPGLTAPGATEFAELFRRGLSADPKTLPTRFLYDADGSALFERITELPEYDLTRNETEILAAHAGEILEESGAREIVEFGSGSSLKTRLLLAELVHRAAHPRYVPIDISGEFLAASAADLDRDFPALEVAPIAGEYFAALATLAPRLPNLALGRRLFLFLGSNLGNFTPEEAERFLGAVAARMEPGDSLLLGLDLVKDERALVAAYDDAQGVTAAFTLNLLRRANRELGADFDLEAFRHDARWNPDLARMEMGIVSLHDQSANVAGETFSFRNGERVQTEFSHKYTKTSAAALARNAGLDLGHWWTDARGRFADALLERA